MANRLRVVVMTGLVFSCCCLCVFILEMIMKESPGAGNIVTLAQFLFIAVEGLVLESKFLTKRRSVPLRHYLNLVIIFFLVTVSNNYALNFNISMPLHMIFKSGSLIANMALGILLLKRRYSVIKYLAVVLITIGIAICTILSTQQHESKTTSDGSYRSPVIGICLLLFSLIASARMGIYQEMLFTNYGKHPREALFYCHLLPLPGFLILFQDIHAQALIFNGSAPMELPLLPWLPAVPKLWLYLVVVAAAQYGCARTVFTLTTECSSLTVTLVLTLRKFFSLVASIIYFKNPFTLYHWAGATLVFAGTFLFSFDYLFMRLLSSGANQEPKTVTAADRRKQE